MPKNNNRRTCFDPDLMIENARSLQRLVNELEQNESNFPMSDPLLFSGVFLASPVLLLFAIELALKAWQCREQNGEHDGIHDLLRLFDKLKPETKKLLEGRMRVVEQPSLPPALEPRAQGMRPGEPLRNLLFSHKDVFITWRYMHEYHDEDSTPRTPPQRVVQTASLDRALTVIIDSYDKRWGDSRWGS